MMRKEDSLAVVILTYNSEGSIERTLRSARKVTSSIFVVDSYSQDRTVLIAEEMGAHVVQRVFENYSVQRNWAITNLGNRFTWQLHIDSDEEVTEQLAEQIRSRLSIATDKANGFLVRRRTVFLGHAMRFGGTTRFHARLFRSPNGHCEERLYDLHFIVDGEVDKLAGFLLDHNETSLNTWTERHNRWSTMEAMQMSGPQGGTETQQLNGPIKRVRARKSLYYRFPLLLRAPAFFAWRYFVLLGFLDGQAGLIFHGLQGLWFRFLVDAKIWEAHAYRRDPRFGSTSSPNESE